MDTILDHKIISSFKEYLSYKILHDLNAYTNKTVSLTKYTPPRKFTGKEVWGSPYAQWIYDSAITGASIPSGVSPIFRGTSGLAVDFKNGRMIVNSGTPISGSVNVSVPDFNVYTTTSSIQKILLEGKFEYAPDLQAANQPVKPDSIIAPCIFISYNDTENKVWALGGVEQTNFTVQVAVFADNIHKMLGIQKVIRDIARNVFPITPVTPLNEWNDLKYGFWDYEMLLTYVNQSDHFVHIDKTTFRILDLDYINQSHPNILVGLGSVNLTNYRVVDNPMPQFPYIYADENNYFYQFDDSDLSQAN